MFLIQQNVTIKLLHFMGSKTLMVTVKTVKIAKFCCFFSDGIDKILASYGKPSLIKFEVYFYENKVHRYRTKKYFRKYNVINNIISFVFFMAVQENTSKIEFISCFKYNVVNRTQKSLKR